MRNKHQWIEERDAKAAQDHTRPSIFCYLMLVNIYYDFPPTKSFITTEKG